MENGKADTILVIVDKTRRAFLELFSNKKIPWVVVGF